MIRMAGTTGRIKQRESEEERKQKVAGSKEGAKSKHLQETQTTTRSQSDHDQTTTRPQPDHSQTTVRPRPDPLGQRVTLQIQIRESNLYWLLIAVIKNIDYFHINSPSIQLSHHLTSEGRRPRVRIPCFVGCLDSLFCWLFGFLGILSIA